MERGSNTACAADVAQGGGTRAGGLSPSPRLVMGPWGMKTAVRPPKTAVGQLAAAHPSCKPARCGLHNCGVPWCSWLSTVPCGAGFLRAPGGCCGWAVGHSAPIRRLLESSPTWGTRELEHARFVVKDRYIACIPAPPAPARCRKLRGSSGRHFPRHPVPRDGGTEQP